MFGVKPPKPAAAARKRLVYDVTRSYYEGKTCPLARFGHDRDGKTGCPIIVSDALTPPGLTYVAVQ